MSQLVFDEALAAQLETLYRTRDVCAAGGWSARPSRPVPATGSWMSAAAPASTSPSWSGGGADRVGDRRRRQPPDPRAGPPPHRGPRQRRPAPGRRDRPAGPRRRLRRRPVGAGAGVRDRPGRRPGRVAPGPAAGRPRGHLGRRLVDRVLALHRPGPDGPGPGRLGRPPGRPVPAPDPGGAAAGGRVHRRDRRGPCLRHHRAHPRRLRGGHRPPGRAVRRRPRRHHRGRGRRLGGRAGRAGKAGAFFFACVQFCFTATRPA